MEESNHHPLNAHLEWTTAGNGLQVCYLSKTLQRERRLAVADNAVSNAQGHGADQVWMRAIDT